MPRRYTSIHDELSILNFISTFGTIISSYSLSLFFMSMWESGVLILLDDVSIDEINQLE